MKEHISFPPLEVIGQNEKNDWMQITLKSN